MELFSNSLFRLLIRHLLEGTSVQTHSTDYVTRRLLPFSTLETQRVDMHYNLVATASGMVYTIFLYVRAIYHSEKVVSQVSKPCFSYLYSYHNVCLNTVRNHISNTMMTVLNTHLYPQYLLTPTCSLNNTAEALCCCYK